MTGSSTDMRATRKFLYLISSHLHGNRRARNVQYTCTITDSNLIYLNPDFTVIIPGISKRYRTPVLWHILQEHYKYNVTIGPDGSGCRIISEVDIPFVSGEYVYTKSISNKYRKWIPKGDAGNNV